MVIGLLTLVVSPTVSSILSHMWDNLSGQSSQQSLVQ
jgi:hypothetical protein